EGHGTDAAEEDHHRPQVSHEERKSDGLLLHGLVLAWSRRASQGDTTQDSRPFGAKTSATMRVPSLMMTAARKVTSSGTEKSGLRSCADAADSARTNRVRAANRKYLGIIGHPRE